MPKTCERIEGCDGGVCWYAAYYETIEGPGGGWCVSYENAADPYIEVQFDNLCLDKGIEIKVDGEHMAGGSVKLTFRGTEMLAAFSDIGRLAGKRESAN